MKLKNLIITCWELPQLILGAIVKKVCKAEKYTTYKDASVYSWNIKGGISLGKYIFVPYRVTPPSLEHVQEDIKHEYGHTVQSKYLGWLYLIVIGLPSLIWANCFMKYRERTGKSYYTFYTERWADRLGEVERGTE